MKILGGLVAMLLVLAVGIAIAVALLFDPKEFQPLLAQSVEKATGRKLTLAGDIGLDFFPCCSIRLGHAALGNPPGFAAGDWRIRIDESGRCRIAATSDSPDVTLGVVELSTIYAGGVPASQLAAAGRVHGDGDALSALSRAFLTAPAVLLGIWY